MTTLQDRPRTALVVIDVQQGVVDHAYDRDAVVVRVAELVEKARAADVPVVWVQHHDDDLPRGSEGWAYVPELAPAPAEPLVHKSWGDAFEETDLEAVLAERQVGRLVVADAHTTEDSTSWGAPSPELVITHTNLYWASHDAPGRTGGTALTADVDFTGDPGRQTANSTHSG